MQGTNVRMKLPFCSQKEKRDENAISADLLSWDVTWEEGRRWRGAGRRARTEIASGKRRLAFSNHLQHNQETGTGPG